MLGNGLKRWPLLGGAVIVLVALIGAFFLPSAGSRAVLLVPIAGILLVTAVIWLSVRMRG